MPHTAYTAVDLDQPTSQEDVPYGSSRQVVDGAPANHVQYQHRHDTVPTLGSASNQTTHHPEQGPDTRVDTPLSSDQGYV